MPTFCDLAEEYAELGDYVMGVVPQNIVENGVLDDGYATLVRSTILEAAVLDDAVQQRATYNIIETAVLNDAATSGLSSANDVVETARLGDGYASKLSQNITEAAVLNDGTSSYVVAGIVETAVLNDAAGGAQTLANSAAETAVLNDAMRQGANNNISETAVLNDAVTSSARFADLAVEIAVLDDASTSFASFVSLIEESAVLGDGFEQRMTGSNNAIEVAYVDDYALGGGSAAWRAHLEPLAMSRYENYPWNSMAVIGGALFGAGPEGLFRLDGATDAGVPISASVTHDWLNKVESDKGLREDTNLKRPRYLYLMGVEGAPALVLSLGYVQNDGGRATAEYPLPSLDPSSVGPLNLRVALGRGIRSQHLRPVIRNVDGADFEYDDGEIIVDSLARSI